MADYRWTGFVLFTLYHMFDNMDGKHARRTRQTSEVGAILDHFVDGTLGIWSGALALQLTFKIATFDIAFGIFAFTLLFWSVHAVHAFTGFFDLGGEYLSIDEAFLFLSLVRAIHAMDVQLPSVLYSSVFHWSLIVFVLFSAVAWMIQHGQIGTKITKKTLHKHKFIFTSFTLYVLWGLYYLSVASAPTIERILMVWAGPYALVLWATRNLH